MRVAIIGNPITHISSGKFLEKFVTMIAPSVERLYVLNDGLVRFDDPKVRVVRATYSSRRLKTLGIPFFSDVASFLAAQIGFTMRLIRLARRYDVVVLFPIALTLPVMMARLLRKKIILYEAQDVYANLSDPMWGSTLRNSVLWSARQYVLRVSDLIIVEGCHVVAQNGIQNYTRKIRICPQYVDSKRYRIMTDWNARRNLIGFIATLDERKGALEFAKAVRELSIINPELTYLIVGAGPLRSKVDKTLADMIRQGIVTIMETIPEENFPAMLNELKMYVLPSTSEGLPNIVLECMASGTPVLATAVGAIPDVVVDGDTGFLLRDGTSESIIYGVSRALEDTNMARIIANARDLTTNRLGYEMVRENWRRNLNEM